MLMKLRIIIPTTRKFDIYFQLTDIAVFCAVQKREKWIFRNVKPIKNDPEQYMKQLETCFK